jgi:hypothetical protein
VERWKSHRDEARNSRHSRLGLVGVVHNTPVNWREDDRQFSTLGADKTGLPAHNSAGIMVDILRMVPVKSRVSTEIAVDILIGLCDVHL